MKEIEIAFKTLKKAMRDDPDYAHSWHCNIAMMCYDSIRAAENMVDDDLAHEDALKVGNDAASRFMKLCFDVNTES